MVALGFDEPAGTEAVGVVAAIEVAGFDGDADNRDD